MRAGVESAVRYPTFERQWGCELSPGGGARFRVCAPGVDALALRLDGADIAMSRTEGGWFEHRSDRARNNFCSRLTTLYFSGSIFLQIREEIYAIRRNPACAFHRLMLRNKTVYDLIQALYFDRCYRFFYITIRPISYLEHAYAEHGQADKLPERSAQFRIRNV